MQYDLHLRQIEKEARAEGEKIGEKRGIAKAFSETAKKLLKLGLSLDKISEATTLSIEELKSLSVQMT